MARERALGPAAATLLVIGILAVASVPPVGGSHSPQAPLRLANTIQTGGNPVGIAVNPMSDRAYVLESNGYFVPGDVRVIDGSTNALLDVISIPGFVIDAVVDEATDQVFVANNVLTPGVDITGYVAVIDGKTDSVLANVRVGPPVKSGWSVAGLAINPNSGVFYATVVGSSQKSGRLVGVDIERREVVANISLPMPAAPIAIIPKTSTLFLGSPDNSTVIIIDGITNTVAKVVAVGFEAWFMALDGASGRVFTMDGQSRVAVIDSISGAIVSRFNGMPEVGDQGDGIAVGPGSQVYVSSNDFGTMSTIEGSTGNILGTTMFQKSDYNQINRHNLAVNPSTGFVYLACSASSRIFVFKDVAMTMRVGASPRGIAFASSNNYTYVANWEDDSVSVIDTSINVVIGVVKVGSEPDAIAFAPSNKDVYVANGGNSTVSVIDTSSHAVIKTLRVGSNPDALTYASSNGDVYVANFDNGTVTVINTVSNTVIKTIRVGGGPSGIAFAPSSNEVYVANYGENTVSVIDAATNTVAKTIPVGTSPWGISFSSSNNCIYVTNYWSKTVSVISTATNKVVKTIPVGFIPTAVAFAPSNGNLYVAHPYDGKISAISTASNKRIAIIAVGRPTSIAYAPSNGNVYVVNEWDNEVIMIDTMLLVTCGSTKVIVGLSTTCQVRITGSPVPTGTGTWSSNASGRFSIKTCKLRGGACTIRYTPTSAGAATIAVNYAGATEIPSSRGTFTLTVSLKESKTKLSCTSAGVPHQVGVDLVKCTARVTGYFPSGIVTWSAGGTSAVSLPNGTACTLTKGSCSITFTQGEGTTTIRAQYQGDTNNLSSSDLVSMSISVG